MQINLYQTITNNTWLDKYREPDNIYADSLRKNLIISGRLRKTVAIPLIINFLQLEARCIPANLLPNL